MNRRGFLAALVAAPAIVKASSLMRWRVLDSGLIAPSAELGFTQEFTAGESLMPISVGAQTFFIKVLDVGEKRPVRDGKSWKTAAANWGEVHELIRDGDTIYIARAT